MKKIKVLILIFVCAVFLILVFGIFGKSKVAKISTPDLRSLKELTVSARLDASGVANKEFPRDLEVYNFKLREITADKAREIARAFGFFDNFEIFNDASYGDVYRWRSEASLTIDKKGLEFANFRENVPSFKSVDLNTFPQIARLYLEEAGLWDQSLFAVNEGDIKFAKRENSHLVKADGVEDAEFAVFGYNFKTGDTLLVNSEPSYPWVIVYLTSDLKLAKLSYMFKPEIEGLGIFSLRAVKEAKKDFGLGKAVLVNFDSGEQTGFYNDSVDEVNLNSLSLAYFLPDSGEGSLQPVYIFEGMGKSNKGVEGNASFFLPALREKYFKAD